MNKKNKVSIETKKIKKKAKIRHPFTREKTNLPFSKEIKIKSKNKKKEIIIPARAEQRDNSPARTAAQIILASFCALVPGESLFAPRTPRMSRQAACTAMK